MSEIETKTIGQLPALPGPLDGTELLEVERPGQASYHAAASALVDLAMGSAVAEAEAARDEAVGAAGAAEAARDGAAVAEIIATAAADTATTQAGNAATSAEAAGDEAEAASQAASDAQDSATAAAGSATTATGAASTAAGAADTATSAATSASGSASAAAASESAAAGSASTATSAAATATTAASTATQAASDAQDSAASAADSANTALIAGREFGVLVAREEGIVTGGYPATRSAWGDMALSRFFAEAMGGGATVAVRVNDDLVHGPVSVSDGQRVTQPVSIVLAEGDTVTFDVSGTATRLWAQIDGGAA